MVQGFSRAMYVEFVERCTMESFMGCHLRAFRHLCGVPAEILCENMKHIVICLENGNPTFLHFSKHYGFTPRFCPPYIPWVKGKVDRPMDFLRETFWRGYSYRSFSQANDGVGTWIPKRFTSGFTGPTGSRWGCAGSRRFLISVIFLLPITTARSSSSVRCTRTAFGNRYYIAAHFAGKKVLLKVKSGVIQIYHDADLLPSMTAMSPEVPHGAIVL